MATRTSKGGSLWRPSGRGRQSIRAKTPAQRSALKCRRKFLRFFPGGFADETYIDWERGYKWEAHQRWMSALAPDAFRALLRERRFADIASHAVAIEYEAKPEEPTNDVKELVKALQESAKKVG